MSSVKSLHHTFFSCGPVFVLFFNNSFDFLGPSISQVACMQLINALVTSPDDLDFRIHLRNEFLRCGLKKILPVSSSAIRLSRMFSLYLKKNKLKLCSDIFTC